MDKVTQSNAAAAEESAAAAEELNAQAGAMKQAVSELLLLVGGANETPDTQAPANYQSKQLPVAGLNLKPLAIRGNGHAAAGLKKAGGTPRGREIPLAGDFNDF
jgi:hypothetical protein